ncbi:MAG TPA: ABC transporter substrate-binding protein [Dehalococcoidia bacterium]|nr:ABC transporter substrate-binding protein [Dehalococcoidia bacterium]
MKKLCLLALAWLLLIPGAVSAQVAYAPPHQKPGPAAERLQFKAFNVDIAPASLRRGEMDLYLYSLKKEAAATLKGVQGVKVYEAPATTNSLILNPAPAPEGQLNPFSIREVRYALNYLVNRAFVSQEIYKGLAQPMVTYVSPTDYDYLTVSDLVRELDLGYDAERGRAMIADALKKAGATLKDGRWNYRDKPIQVRFIIRVEDERREVGDLIRAELDKAGLTVIPVYDSFAPAILTVYGSDPQLFQWHLYTEGWGKGGAERYDYANANQMAAPWLGNMPGWQEVGFWQYQNPTLDQLGQRLFRGDFANQQERDNLYRQIARLSTEESVRIWLATVVNTFPASGEVRGITEDVASGPRSLWTLREAYLPGKDTLTIGNVWVDTARSTWNPVGGFGDVYSVDIWRNVFDPPLATHPFKGTPLAYRASFQVKTSGPQGKLDVPSDAFLWDAKAKAFRPVGAGRQAISLVTFDFSRYLGSNWHHGQPITTADILYNLYQTFDLVYDENKARIEPALALTSKPYLDTFRGFRLDGSKLEVYVDNWHFDTSYIASYASVVALTMPWEILAATDRMVFEDRRAAYSDTAAGRQGVPWLNLAMPRDSLFIRRILLDFQEKAFVPQGVFQVGGKTFLTREEALARYNAAIQWIDRYQMAVISNGPFKMVRFDPAAQFAELQAFRDPTYPFKPGDGYYGSIPRVAIPKVDAKPIEPGAKAEVLVSLEGTPPLSLRYSLYDPVGRKNLLSGEAEKRAEKQFAVTLSPERTSALKPGLYQLFLLASSSEVAAPTEERVELEVAIPRQVTPTPGGTPTATPRLTPTGTPGLTPPPPTPRTPSQIPWPWIIAIGALVVVVALLLTRRRKPS